MAKPLLTLHGDVGLIILKAGKNVVKNVKIGKGTCPCALLSNI